MNTVEQAEALVAKMTRGEKALLLQHIARDLGDAYPGIDVTDGVSGGEPCISLHANSDLDPRTGSSIRRKRGRTSAVVPWPTS